MVRLKSAKIYILCYFFSVFFVDVAGIVVIVIEAAALFFLFFVGPIRCPLISDRKGSWRRKRDGFLLVTAVDKASYVSEAMSDM